MKVYVNSRILSTHLTGVQRYLQEILAQWESDVQLFPHTCVHPRRDLRGASGHIWEQTMLPLSLRRNSMLFSPSNTGPLTIKQQTVTIHDVVPLDHPEWLTKEFAAWYSYIVPRVAERANRVIAISDFTKERLLRHCNISDEKIVRIHNGVDGRFKPAGEEEKAAALKELKIPYERFILSLSSLEPRKNISALLRAWARVSDQLDDSWGLVIAGKSGSPRIFQDAEIASSPTRTFFTGHVPDRLLPSLYSAASLFCYLSLYEGFGLPPLEAMACGTPAFTSNVGAILEVVGDAALTANPSNDHEIEEALISLCNSETRLAQLSSLGLARAQRFSWERCAKETWEAVHGT